MTDTTTVDSSLGSLVEKSKKLINRFYKLLNNFKFQRLSRRYTNIG